jgi:hypothetical protein
LVRFGNCYYTKKTQSLPHFFPPLAYFPLGDNVTLTKKEEVLTGGT